MNVVMLVGKLGRDVKAGVSTKGVSWANVSMATQTRRGEAYDTTWHNISCFGKLAESIRSAKKGDRAIVTGSIQNSEYTDKDGIKQTRTQVHANEFLYGPSFKTAAASQQIDHNEGGGNYDEDNIPF